MKSIKALAAVALASSLFIGCEEEEHFGIDSSKPAPKEFTYDEENSSETSISVYWDDARPARPSNSPQNSTMVTTTTMVSLIPSFTATKR